MVVGALVVAEALVVAGAWVVVGTGAWVVGFAVVGADVVGFTVDVGGKYPEKLMSGTMEFTAFRALATLVRPLSWQYSLQLLWRSQMTRSLPARKGLQSKELLRVMLTGEGCLHCCEISWEGVVPFS